MKTNSSAPDYKGFRFPPEIISHCIWLYFRFSLSFRDSEELMAERGIIVTYETIRQWTLKFGQTYTNVFICSSFPWLKEKNKRGGEKFPSFLFCNFPGIFKEEEEYRTLHFFCTSCRRGLRGGHLVEVTMTQNHTHAASPFHRYPHGVLLDNISAR